MRDYQKNIMLYLGAFYVVCVLHVVPAQAGMVACASFTGENQGEIAGEVTDQGKEDMNYVYGLRQDMYLPDNISTNYPASEKKQSPITLIMRVSKATPKLLQAWATGEKLTSVEIRFYRITQTGTEEHYFTISPRNCYIVSTKLWSPDSRDSNATGYTESFEVSLIYESITFTYEPDGIQTVINNP